MYSIIYVENDNYKKRQKTKQDQIQILYSIIYQLNSDHASTKAYNKVHLINLICTDIPISNQIDKRIKTIEFVCSE